MTSLAPGWAATNLESLVTFSIGGLWGSAPGSGAPKASTVAVMRGADYRNWATTRASGAAIRSVATKAAASRRLEAGDLVIEVLGGGPTQPVGRVVVIDDAALASSNLPLISSNFCRRVVLDREVNPWFVYYQLLFRYLSGDTERFQTATTNIRNLNFKKYLAETMLAVAPLPEQERIVAAIAEQFSQIDAGVAALERVVGPSVIQTGRVGRLRSAILAAAFSGHLVAQVPDDESAEALLERIAADGVSSKKHKPVRARKPRTLRPSSGDKKEQKKRRIGLQLMWNEGHSMAEIAATMEITTAKLGNEMTRMRKEGWDLPYRRRRATA